MHNTPQGKGSPRRPRELGRHGAPRVPAAGRGERTSRAPQTALLSAARAEETGEAGPQGRRGPDLLTRVGLLRQPPAHPGDRAAGASLPQEHLPFLTYCVSPTDPQLAQPQPFGPPGYQPLGIRDSWEDAQLESRPLLGGYAQGTHRERKDFPGNHSFVFCFCTFSLTMQAPSNGFSEKRDEEMEIIFTSWS